MMPDREEYNTGDEMKDKESPKTMWITPHDGWSSPERTTSNAVKYYRADVHHACIEAGCSLNYHLFEIQSALLTGANTARLKDLLIDAQPALDKWNRFLDGKEK